MPLHLQHHKSYHPYNQANIERVQRDEQEAQRQREQTDEQVRLAETEARLEVLRQQSRKRKDDGDNDEETDRVKRKGHIHDWNLTDQAYASSSRTRLSQGDGSHTEKQKRDQNGEQSFGQIETQPWYQDEALQSGRERKKTQEQRLEEAYKDSVRKRSHDPLRSMPSSALAATPALRAEPLLSSSEPHDIWSEARLREAREQERVNALLQAKRSQFRIEQTPTPVHTDKHEYSDQYYRDDVRAAKAGQDRPYQDFPEGVELNDQTQQIDSLGAETKESQTEMNGDIGVQIKVDDEDGEISQALKPIDANTMTNTANLSAIQMSRSDSESDSRSSTSSTDSKGRPKESMYPTIFGEMIATVMESESYLFTTNEQALLGSFSELHYEARHLFARLIQRRSAWHRVDKLNYDFDVADKVSATLALCTPNASIPCQDGDDLSRFCLSESDMEEGFEGPLALLTLEELKILAKNMNRLKGATTKAAIISALLTTKSQGTLHGFTRDRLAANQVTVNSQSAVLRQQLTEVVGGCVRVCPRVQALIDRVALVYYRGAELGGSALTTAVLSRSRKRTYPDYAWKRSERLFASRRHLLDMQRALELEVQMEQWIEWDGSPAAITKALSTFETVYEEWKAAVGEAQSMAPDVQDLGAYNRMRFHPGWPLTRVIYKGVYVLGRLHKHEREVEVLRSLLAQKVFRRGRRGDWYDRLALVIMHYPPSTTPNVIRKAKREALEVAVKGIEDPDTHLIYHDTLQRRIVRLENQLKLPFSEKHDFSYAKLQKCSEQTYNGVRLDKMMGVRKGIFGTTLPVPGRANSTRRTSPGVAADGESAEKLESFTYRAPLHKVVKVEKINTNATPSNGNQDADVSVQRREIRKDMHSVWRGLDGEACGVESLVLQHFAEDGFKGFHCEGGVLTMLFALLMWDIVFMHVDGVFETPYQRQPLDLTEDSFSIVRGPALRSRLMEIENTGGLDLIRTTDERERERKTWAIGCRWDHFERQDLLEIAECMGGKALSVVCQMLAEEWSHCTAGMPDLCVWRYADKQVRFCEVKGPGDKLSEKQKLWIDVLLRAGVNVEVSKVQEGIQK